MSWRGPFSGGASRRALKLSPTRGQRKTAPGAVATSCLAIQSVASDRLFELGEARDQVLREIDEGAVLRH